MDLIGEKAFLRLQKSFLKRSPVQAERLGESLSVLWYTLDKKHRNRTLKNLSMAFPEWNDSTCQHNSKEVFRHFGRISGDFFRSPIRTNEEVIATTEVFGLEHLEEAEAMGHGVLMMTGHLGNWERFAQWAVAIGRPLTVVARDANQEGVQSQVLRIRESVGVEVLSRGNTARQALVLLRKNKRLGILPDQNSADCFVPFFGRPCGTVTGPAVLHRRTGAAILPCYCVRLDYNRYRVIGLPLIDPGNQEEDVVALTAKMNEVLESVIREYPTQWLWMHDRWKSARQKGLF
jgi:KDO2-lipid IV(A) lauroyltransferase